MRKILYSLIIIFIIHFDFAHSQSFVPYNVLRAIEKGTRTTEGIPGKLYFQNYAKYTINAFFDPESGKLSGKERIVYYNNSRDTLRRIVIRLYQNIMKKGGIRDESFNPDDIHNGVNISFLLVNGSDLLKRSKSSIKQEGTNLIVYLSDPVKPSDSCNMIIQWDFSMPSGHLHRYGKYHESSYFVAYWYPQVAVYDDIDGWDMMNYTGTHEFYNDFNSFDVTIEVSDNHMVWATGIWQNPGKVLNNEIVVKLGKAFQSDDVVRIINQNDWKSNTVFSKKGSHSFQFIKDSIPDFAFAVSNNYLWDASSVIIDSSLQKRVWVSSVYHTDATNFRDVASIGCQVIHELNYNSYGFTFPFPGITIFNGSGGTEFPMIVNNENMSERNGTVFITMHEIAHSYFPFLTGINERKYSWLDEGLTTYLPAKTEKTMHSDYYPIELIINRYIAGAGTEIDIPLYVPAYQTRDYSYQFYSYFRPAVALYILEEYIGRKQFRDAIRNFIETWQYKHPLPYDFFQIVMNHTTKNIDWFIDAWFFNPGWPDLAIGEVKVENDSIQAEILNKGILPVPVILTIEYTDGSNEIVRRELDVWKGNDRILINHLLKGKIKSIHLDYKYTPDKDHSNNGMQLSSAKE